MLVSFKKKNSLVAQMTPDVTFAPVLTSPVVIVNPIHS